MVDIRGMDATRRPTPIATDSFGRVLVNTRTHFGAAFRADITVVAAVGNAATLYCGASHKLHVKEIGFLKPSAALTLKIVKQSTLDSGGTSTFATIAPLGSSPPSAASLKLYTVAPTAGTSLGNIFNMAIAVSDVLSLTFGNNNQNDLVINGDSNEALAINVSAIATIYGYIEWVEDGEAGR